MIAYSVRAGLPSFYEAIGTSFERRIVLSRVELYARWWL
jgi:hypothetical protein